MKAFFVGLALSFIGALGSLSYNHPVFTRKLLFVLLGFCILIQLGICCYKKGWADASSSKSKLNVGIYDQMLYIAYSILFALLLFCLFFKPNSL